MKKTIGYALLGLCSVPILASWVYMAFNMTMEMLMGLSFVVLLVLLTGFGIYLIREDL